MMAGVQAARRGYEVHLYEKNEKLGKKLYITGKGRCNLTNNCDVEELLSNVVTNPKFLYSAFYTFPSQSVMDFFEQAGVPLKTERGGRVFPQSDHSSDIIRALERELKQAGVRIHLNTKISGILTENKEVRGIVKSDGTKIYSDHVLIATGGLSYPSTGSTGDGYFFAKECGHRVTDQSPSLVPLITKEEYIPRLQGLSLRNVSLTMFQKGRKIFEDFGEMMFTGNGVTGPMILSASSRVGPALDQGELDVLLDLKPALSLEQLDQRILRDFGERQNRQFKNAVAGLFPSSLTPIMIELSQIDPEKKSA